MFKLNEIWEHVEGSKWRVIRHYPDKTFDLFLMEDHDDTPAGWISHEYEYYGKDFDADWTLLTPHKIEEYV